MRLERKIAATLITWLALVLLMGVLALPASAAPEEVWVTANPWMEASTDVGDDLDDNRMRDSYLALVTDDTKWPDLLAETTVWRSYMRIVQDVAFADGCPAGVDDTCAAKPLSDAELEDLVEFVNDNGLLVAFETGGLRLPMNVSPRRAPH